MTSKVVNPHRSNDTENTADEDATAQDAPDDRALFEAYSAMSDLLQLTGRVMSITDGDVPEDDPHAQYNVALKDFVYRGEACPEDLGDLVGQHPRTKAEAFAEYGGDENQVTEFEAIEAVPVSEAAPEWFDLIVERHDGTDESDEFYVPVVEGARLPVSVDEDEALNQTVSALSTLYKQATEGLGESESEDEPAQDGGSGVITPESTKTVEPSGDDDLTQREAVLRVLRGADDDLRDAVRESRNGYRQTIINRVEQAYGVSPSPNNVSKIAGDFRDAMDEPASEDEPAQSEGLDIDKDELLKTAAEAGANAAVEAVEAALDA